MAGPQIQNRTVGEIPIKTLLDAHARDMMLNLNCHAIATITAFDSSSQKVSATINYKKTFMQADANGVYFSVLVDYPALVECPVIVMQGGTAALTFPIEVGDSCLILFNDRDMDNWVHGGQVTGPNTKRLHSFSDGIALVGLRPFSNPISDYDTTRVVLKKGDAMVGVGNELIKISNEVTTLKTLINGLIDIITVLTTAMSGANAGNIPSTIATPSSVATTTLDAYKDTVGELLE